MGFFYVCALCRKSGSILTPHARHRTEVCFFFQVLGFWEKCDKSATADTNWFPEDHFAL